MWFSPNWDQISEHDCRSWWNQNDFKKIRIINSIIRRWDSFLTYISRRIPRRASNTGNTTSTSLQSSWSASPQLSDGPSICDASFGWSLLNHLFCIFYILITSSLSNSSTWFVGQRIFRRIYCLTESGVGLCAMLPLLIVSSIWNPSPALLSCDR